MSKKHLAKQIVTIPSKPIKGVSLDLKSNGGVQVTIMSKYAGSIEFSDDEFSAMLQALKDDK